MDKCLRLKTLHEAKLQCLYQRSVFLQGNISVWFLPRNASRFHAGSSSTYSNFSFGWTNVKDVALAHIIAYEVASANGRYCLVGRVAHYLEIVEIIHEYWTSNARQDNIAPGPVLDCMYCTWTATLQVQYIQPRCCSVTQPKMPVLFDLPVWLFVVLHGQTEIQSTTILNPYASVADLACTHTMNLPMTSRLPRWSFVAISLGPFGISAPHPTTPVCGSARIVIMS